MHSLKKSQFKTSNQYLSSVCQKFLVIYQFQIYLTFVQVSVFLVTKQDGVFFIRIALDVCVCVCVHTFLQLMHSVLFIREVFPLEKSFNCRLVAGFQKQLVFREKIL